MIIGISGKINSGKDTVGQIIQYLITINKVKPIHYNKCNIETILKEYNNNAWWIEENSNYSIKQFAHTLKIIANLLTGIPIEDFEKQKVKDSYLSKDWCISEYSMNMTVREMLQKIGTDCMRNNLHKNVWVNALFSKYINNDNKQFPNWIITDVRFPNEAKAIEDRNGFNIRINRDFCGNNNDITIIRFENDKSHISEIALDNYSFKYTINNNGTINELIEQIKQILIKEKII